MADIKGRVGNAFGVTGVKVTVAKKRFFSSVLYLASGMSLGLQTCTDSLYHVIGVFCGSPDPYFIWFDLLTEKIILLCEHFFYLQKEYFLSFLLKCSNCILCKLQMWHF